MEFEQIYALYFKDVYHFILSLCRDSVEAEEITQETFCTAMEKMEFFRGECKMTVWLCQIAKHLYFARQKERKRQTNDPGRILDDITEDSDSLEQRLSDEAEALHIHELLHCLREPYKEVFMLRVFGELSFKKIAHIFGKTENWARVTYYRAKVKLLEEMEESNGKNNM